MKFLLVVVLALLFFTVVSKPACTRACEVNRNSCPSDEECPSCFACGDKNGDGKKNILISKVTPKEYMNVIYQSMKELDCSFTKTICSCVDVVENAALEEKEKEITLQWLNDYCSGKTKKESHVGQK